MVFSFHFYNKARETETSRYLESAYGSSESRLDDERIYLGTYRVINSEGYDMCYVQLWNTHSAERLMNRDQDSLFQAYWFEPLVYSPNSERKIQIEGNIIRVMIYGLNPEKTLEQFMEFDKRVTERYSGHMNQIDWKYMGTFKVNGFKVDKVAEIDFVKASSPEEAHMKRIRNWVNLSKYPK